MAKIFEQIANLKPIEGILTKEGLTREFGVKKLKEELDAQDVKSVKVEGYSGQFTKLELPNWKIQQDARRDLMRLHGDLIEKKEISGPGGGPITFVMDFSGKKDKPKKK
jgi:hypothetical protein